MTKTSVIYRGRVRLVDPASSRAGQPYHAAAELPDLSAAEEFLAHCRAASGELARSGIAKVVSAVREHGYAPKTCGIVLASGRPLGALASTLASHAAIHTAEGEFFRGVIRAACKESGWQVTGVPEKDLWARASAEIGETEDALRARVAGVGKSIGAPWTADEKSSTVVGWVALASVLER